MSLVKFVKVRAMVEEEPLVKIRSPKERENSGADAMLKALEQKRVMTLDSKTKVSLDLKPVDDTGTKEHTVNPGTPALVEKL